ncbi:MAG: DUF4783 domain-containing protein [Bacteroidia bacterium]
MKTRASLFVLLVSVFSFAFTIDLIDDIAAAIRSGNPKNISKFFIENVDMKIIDQDAIYSKQQAEMILKDFFSKHAVKSYTTIHKSEPKAGSQYVIGSLETASGKFRTYFLIKTTGASTLIQQFRIETENE